ncbi:MAG: hypothetical protein V1915_02860 [Candidatus Bathyarchaeota archaeon]
MAQLTDAPGEKTQHQNVHWVGLASGILLIAVILLSLNNPWWQLRIGDLGYANISPLHTDFSLLGMTFLSPILTAVNISCLLVLSISAALMIVYSVNPTKTYAKQLLCWSYKKPLSILITFVVGIVGLSVLASYIASNYAHIDLTLPILGTSRVQVPSELFGGLSGFQISVAVSGGFHWTFYLAIAATVLCVVSRLLHGKPIAKPTEPSPIIA